MMMMMMMMMMLMMHDDDDDDDDESTCAPAGIEQLAARPGQYQESPGFKWDGGAGKVPTPNIHDK